MKRLLFIFAIIIALVLTGCSEKTSNDGKGQEKKEKGEPKAAEAIELTDASGQKITFDKEPKTFAALSSGDLDILVALGAHIVGRPSSEHVSKELKDVTEIGNPHQPNFEKLASSKADVLVAGLSFQQHAKNVEGQGTKVVYTQANSIQDITDTITLFGAILHKEDKAKEINEEIAQKVKEAESVEQKSVKTLLVYGAPGTFLAALPNSLSGDILEKAGGENIAADFEKEEQYPQYASLSIEKVVERNPEVVMLITHGEPKAVKEAFSKEMEKKAAWKNLDAVKNNRVIVLPAHLFGTNPGTQVIEALHVMQEQLAAVQ